MKSMGIHNGFALIPEVEVVYRTLLIAHIDIESEQIDRCLRPST